jgi:hypothetical protein
MDGAAQALLADDRIGPAAGAATDEAGQQALWSPAIVWLLAGAMDLQSLRPVPQILVDDPEFGDIDNDPILPGIDLGNAPARLRVFDEPLPVVDEAPDIEFVPQDPIATSAIAVNRARVPLPATWPWNAVGVEMRRDSSW